MRFRSGVFLRSVVALLAASGASAADNDGDLAKKLNNPISDLVSVPLQFNWEFGNGPDEDTWHVQNFQPVVPFHITDRTNMIGRLIMPSITTPGETVAGDMVCSLFFSPATSEPFIWGAGPVMLLPRVGEKWALGPTAVVLEQKGPWTYGFLFNHAWSFAGDQDAPDFNQTFFQPFLAHTNDKALTLTLQSETTANWEAPNGDEWSIPLNFIVSKVARFGPFPASYGVGPGVYLESPSGGPEWKIRGVVTLMLPGAK